MRRLRSVLVRLLGVFSRARRERDLAAELESHLQLHIDDNLRAGMTPAEARRRALVALGGVDQTTERVRDARATVIDAIRQDVVFALRQMRRSPMATGAVVLSLALGLGAIVAPFSVLDSLALQHLPVREPTSLALLLHNGGSEWSHPQWEQISARSSLFDGALAASGTTFDLAAAGLSEPVDGLYVSGGFFDVLGVPAVVGRTFGAVDDSPGGGPDGPVAVLSYGFWQRRYGGDAAVIGRTLTLNRVPCTIVGVTPAGFTGVTVARTFDVAVPIAVKALLRGQESDLGLRGSFWLNPIMVRLRAGQTIAQAAATIHAVQPQIRAATMPTNWDSERQKGYLARPIDVEPGGRGYSLAGSRSRPPIVTLAVTAGLLLLVACANTAAIGLERATSRERELATRVSLGASRAALARLLLVESSMLSIAGALAGLGIAHWTSVWLVRGLSQDSTLFFLDVRFDWREAAFTLGATVLAGLLCGIGPAARAAGTRAHGASAVDLRIARGERRLGVHGAILVGQTALALVIVVAAGLFARTAVTLSRVGLGFDPDRVVVADLDTRRSGSTREGQLALVERLRKAAAAVPGVQHAAVSTVTPLAGWRTRMAVEVVGQPRESDPLTHTNIVSPGWFATHGTALVAGRDFDDGDLANAPRVAIVNREFVRQFLHGSDRIGRQVRRVGEDARTSPLTIVGVVADAAYRRLREPPPPTLYLAYAQQRGLLETSLSIRSAGPPVAVLMPTLAAALGAVDSTVSFTFRPLAAALDAAWARERLVAMAATFFACLALLLAALGLYGGTSYSVGRRRSEIGIRMALGAAPTGVVRVVLGRVACLVSLGVVVGAIVSLWAVRFVESLLFGVTARDPLTFAGAAAVLVATALLAGWLPARRAARIDPVSVLREN